MDSYLISFQLNNQKDYNKVSDCIRECSKWARVMDNVWIIKSDRKLTDIRDNISSLIKNSGGSVLVVRISNDAWGTYSVSTEVTDWMKNNI